MPSLLCNHPYPQQKSVLIKFSDHTHASVTSRVTQQSFKILVLFHCQLFQTWQWGKLFATQFNVKCLRASSHNYSHYIHEVRRCWCIISYALLITKYNNLGLGGCSKHGTRDSKRGEIHTKLLDAASFTSANTHTHRGGRERETSPLGRKSCQKPITLSCFQEAWLLSGTNSRW